MTGWEVVTQELLLESQWQLGAGGRAVWAPPCPTQWSRPGFRDPGIYAGEWLDPVFAITLLDSQGRFLPLHADSRRWTPSCLELKYNRPEVSLTERRAVLSSDVFTSQLALSHEGDSARDFWIVLWTRRKTGPGESVVDIDANPQGISFLEMRHDTAGNETTRWGCAIGSSFDADSWSVNHASVPGVDLDWPCTPFVQVMNRTGLPGLLPPCFDHEDSGYLFFALAYPVTVPPGDKLKLNFMAALAPDAEAARSTLEDCVGMIDPIHTSEEEWISWFEEVPSFECSDRMLQRAYWYRWAQRRIWYQAVRPGSEPCRQDSDAGRWIEDCWRLDREEIQVAIEDLLRRDIEELADFPLSLVLRRTMGLHPDADFVADLGARARRLKKLIQELTLSALSSDVTECATSIRSTLRRRTLAADLLAVIGQVFDSAEIDASELNIERTLADMVDRIRKDHWSTSEGWFVDLVQSSEGVRSSKTIFGLLPLLIDMATTAEAAVVKERVFDPERFWTAPPLPSVSRDDLAFRPRPEGFDQLDGRVCPSLVSLAIECLGKAAERKTPQERLLLMQALRSTVNLIFTGGDLDKPACFDSYHPIGGYPSMMLGPSPPSGWLVDHLIRFVAGLRPSEDGRVIIDPLPSGVEWFRLERALVGEHEIDIEWDQRSGLAIRLDGQPAGHAPVGRTLSIDLSWNIDVPRGNSHRATIG